MTSTAKKKVGLKERFGAEGASGATNLQSPFVSAAHNTVWPYDAAMHFRDGQTIFTAAANAIHGRPNGAYRCDDAWTRVESPLRDRSADHVLPVSEEWKAERAMYAHFPAIAGPLEARPSISCSLADVRDTLYEEWLGHIATYRASPREYPHHVMFLAAPAVTASAFSMSGAHPCQSFLRVATVLSRLLEAYLRRCNEQPEALEQQANERVPSHVFARLLGSAVYNINFSEPSLEQKDTAFGWVAPPGQGGSDMSEPGVTHASVAATGPAPVSSVTANIERIRTRQPPALPRRYDALSVVSCADATHINVCVGQHFYKLCVMDEREGYLRDVASLAADLGALHAHHLSLAHTDVLPGASPAVRQDRKDVDAMIANLSCLTDEVAFDVRRRLRVSSKVNAYSLDALEAGLCTLVLREVDKRESESSGSPTTPVAQWLHSGCCLETSLAHPEQWTVRLQALVVPVQAGMEWVERAFAQPSHTFPTERTVDDPVALDAGGAVVDVTNQGGTVQRAAFASHELSTPVGVYGKVEHLELWLPEKHRVPLRPYAAPVWNRADAQHPLSNVSSGACTLVDFCMCLLRVTAEWKRGGHLPVSSTVANGWPHVVVAVQPPRGGAPSLMALNSPAVQNLFEVLASPQLLFAVDARHRVEAEARAEVATLLNISWYATSTVRTAMKDVLAESRLFEGVETTANAVRSRVDVCVSFALLPRQAAPPSDVSTRAPVISRLLSDLSLPSSFLVNCTTQQTAAEAHVRVSHSTLVDAVVGADAPAAVPLARAFAAALTSCMLDRR
ncbi:hypothetical protein NXY56_004295 [Leishmania guyanensis]|uniref:Choline/carnitine acyltransferase domain-containing protein n=1 Tax=Leishmania guyanensis TaxID=5670 RepID=A0A1E1IZX5_LEIGU|nr:hypothetical protein, conserved [Leishmania guyanensis]